MIHPNSVVCRRVFASEPDLHVPLLGSRSRPIWLYDHRRAAHHHSPALPATCSSGSHSTCSAARLSGDHPY